MKVVKKLSELTKPYWSRIFGGIILGLMVSGITGAIAWSVKPALDEILVGRKYEYLKLLPLGIFLLFSTKGLLSFGQTYLMKSAGMKLVRETRNKLYNHILCLPVGYFSRASSGAIISRVMMDVEALNGLVSDVVKTFIVEIPTIIFLLGVALYRSWDLTLMSLLLLPLIAYSTRKIGKGVKKKRKEAQRKLSLLTHRIGESVFGARIIKVFNREKTMADKFKNDNQRYYREHLRVLRLKEFTKLVIDIVTGVGIAVVLWYGGGMIVQGTITTGVFASILVAIYMMFSPVKKLGEAYNALQEARASIERIETLQNVEHEQEGRISIDGFRKAIKFEDVSFTFPGNNVPVLKDVNLEINRGEVVAIVGRSGVGKSTLVDLIPKFHIPSSGRLTVDGIDIHDIEMHSLREQIGIVSQDIILFNDTVGENIAFGKSGVSAADIMEAARTAYADEFIQQLPEKYDTFIGDRGLKLSGGQRQRIAIARAVLKNPPILILDEATSSLDSVSEALVQKALDVLMKGRTTIVIAHRLSTIKNADRILIIEKGKILDAGRHEELLTRNSTYKELYNALA
ncbi:MAG: transporter related protein [Nitrospirae bacterium]|nr:transporter related protein [Nitrospirota bacterium]MBS1232590.1 transporter related protein [Nitrospirota bacterium]